MSTIQIMSKTREDALREALDRLQLPEEALEIEWSEEEQDLLAGAKPFVQINVRIRPGYVGEKIEECTRALLAKMQIEHEIRTTELQGISLVSIDSPQSDALIGYHGETLDALQHLIIRMARLNGRDIPLVLVDVADYRLKRIERLKRVADELVALVLETGNEEHFDPMDATDRKIVHTLLKAYPGIKTFSRGEDMNRRVIIAREG